MAVSVKSAQRKPLSYKGYLKLDELLGLQKPLSKPAQHDELLFVIAHQVYELWFKLMVDELETAISLMSSGDLYEAARLIRRVVTIQKVLIQQLEVLETIRPTDFLKFRSVLSPASGFQSLQFRELEFVSGQKEEKYLDLHKQDKPDYQKLFRKWESPALWDGFRQVLKSNGFAVEAPAEKEQKERERIVFEKEVDAVVAVYSESGYSAVVELAEALLEYDKYFWLWRNHHMGMVEMIIGRKHGTGAEVVKETMNSYSFQSSDVAYLKTTLRRRFFPALWAARTKISEV
ncbi:MAG TPA: tryptophan 2,3-dioxygenase family protein [Nitrososphaerales archaeon]|nr:tryptophan 2,3-dioxygenase family protein [Nitrososphaerales archaeon]